MIRVGIIINANAKKNRRMKGNPAEIYAEIGGPYVDIRFTRSLDELESVIKEFKKLAVSYIGVAGGDGSLHHALTRSIKVYGEKKVPPIIILKGGTMDNVSRSIHLKGKGPAILKRLVDKIRHGEKIETERRGTMKIGDSCCFIFGTGFVTNFLNEAYAGREKGNIRNIQVIGKAIRQMTLEPETGSLFKGTPGCFSCDGKKLDLDCASAILAGTVEHVGMGFSPLYRALEKDKAFHAIVTGLGPAKFIRYILKLKKGARIDEPGHFDLVAKSLKIESPGTFEYTMDGDIYTAQNRLEVKSGPLIDLVYV